MPCKSCKETKTQLDRIERLLLQLTGPEPAQQDGVTSNMEIHQLLASSNPLQALIEREARKREERKRNRVGQGRAA